MATPEAKVKARVKRILHDVGCYYVMPATGGYGNSGVPDFLICYKGKFIGLECKANSKVPTALQYENLKKIQDNGGETLIVDENNMTQLYEVFGSYDS